MADPFKLTHIFTKDDIDQLFEIYVSKKGMLLSQDFNLYNVTKKNIAHKNPRISPMIQKLTDHCNRKVTAVYFLKYKVGSFAKSHVDNPDNNFLTAITMVRTSEDLVGGESLIIKNLEQSDIKRGSISTMNSKTAKKLNFMGKPVLPIIVRQSVGTTLWYERNVLHGVTRVDRGERIVLVTWFGEENA